MSLQQNKALTPATLEFLRGWSTAHIFYPVVGDRVKITDLWSEYMPACDGTLSVEVKAVNDTTKKRQVIKIADNGEILIKNNEGKWEVMYFFPLASRTACV